MLKNSLFSFSILLAVVAFLSFSSAMAQPPKVGRKAAAKYLANNKSDDDSRSPAASAGGGGGGDRLLMLGLGTYINSKTYAWQGSDSQDNVGRANYGVTYLFDEWNGIDVNFRAEFSEFQLDKDNATKLSLMPLWTFPSANSRFPLYFGAGIGPGVFFKQIKDESAISLDYQLVAGVRFMDLFQNCGFFAELGMKNHLHLLSDGQFNGTALNAGVVFSF